MQKAVGVVLLWVLLITTGGAEKRKPDGVASTGGRAFQCPEAEGRYPHESLCYMFYECVDYIPYDYECPDDELYSQEQQYCMPPGEVDCGNLLPRPTTSGWTPTTESGSSSTNWGSFQCPTAEGIYPHDTYCYMYYHCIDFYAYPHECPDEELFSQQELFCMHPEDVNCGDLLPRPTTSIRPPTSTTDGSGSTSGGFQCPEPNGFFPDPESCGSFYECVNGNVFFFECPDGLWFNPNYNNCDFPGDFCTPLNKRPMSE